MRRFGPFEFERRIPGDREAYERTLTGDVKYRFVIDCDGV